MKNNNYLIQFVRWNMVILFLTSCSAVQVQSSKIQPGALAGTYATFNFYDTEVKAADSVPIHPERMAMLKDAIERELKAAGLEKSADPDLWVNIGVVVENKVQTRETNIREAPIYVGQRNYHWESQEVVVDQYKEGTVTIDLVDADTEAMVAQSVASSVIVADDDKMLQRINEGMAKVFDDLAGQNQ